MYDEQNIKDKINSLILTFALSSSIFHHCSAKKELSHFQGLNTLKGLN